MRSARLCIAILFIWALCPPALADGASGYESGMVYYQARDYAAALSAFQEAPGYKDSEKWILYMRALVSIQENDIALAAALLEPLAEREFEQAAQWLTYCFARDAQAIGNYYYARGLYKTIDVGDSLDRYLEMHARITGEYEGADDAPMRAYAPAKPPISARVTAQISVYAGPGANYMQLPFKLDTDAGVVVYELSKPGVSSWYMIGCEADGLKYRAWASSARVSPAKNAPLAANRADKMRLTVDCAPRYGPGEDYAACDFTLAKGARAIVVDEECGYYLAEFAAPDISAPVRAWFPAHFFN